MQHTRTPTTHRNRREKDEKARFRSTPPGHRRHRPWRCCTTAGSGSGSTDKQKNTCRCCCLRARHRDVAACGGQPTAAAQQGAAAPRSCCWLGHNRHARQPMLPADAAAAGRRLLPSCIRAGPAHCCCALLLQNHPHTASTTRYCIRALLLTRGSRCGRPPCCQRATHSLPASSGSSSSQTGVVCGQCQVCMCCLLHTRPPKPTSPPPSTHTRTVG